MKIWQEILKVPDKPALDVEKEIAAIKVAIQNIQKQINGIKELAQKIAEV